MMLAPTPHDKTSLKSADTPELLHPLSRHPVLQFRGDVWQCHSCLLSGSIAYLLRVACDRADRATLTSRSILIPPLPDCVILAEDERVGFTMRYIMPFDGGFQFTPDAVTALEDVGERMHDGLRRLGAIDRIVAQCDLWAYWAAFSHVDSSYIGDEDEAVFLRGLGIAPEAIPGNKVASIGFCEREQKWYGWSHRAIFGYGIGDECLYNQHPDCDGFICLTLDDCKRAAIAFACDVSALPDLRPGKPIRQARVRSAWRCSGRSPP